MSFWGAYRDDLDVCDLPLLLLLLTNCRLSSGLPLVTRTCYPSVTQPNGYTVSQDPTCIGRLASPSLIAGRVLQAENADWILESRELLALLIGNYLDLLGITVEHR